MFYGVASPDWRPGHPLSLSGALLFRSILEAKSFAPEASSVAVAVRFDARRNEVRPEGQAASTPLGSWSAPAVGNSLGGVIVFGPIPAALVRPTVESEAKGRCRPDNENDSSRPVRAGFGGWDSLTMALLA
jgi:hypothetical protein